jgi:O-glycosyl hydrolase
MGHWSSDAFMRYLRKQVLSLSHGISTKMLTYEEFYTVPDFIHTVADGDPRTRINANLATTHYFNGSHMKFTYPNRLP